MDELLLDLANENGLSQEAYLQIVRQAVGKIFPVVADELAEHRKEIALLRKTIENITGEKLPITKFTLANEEIEALKINSKILVLGGQDEGKI